MYKIFYITRSNSKCSKFVRLKNHTKIFNYKRKALSWNKKSVSRCCYDKVDR